MALILNINTAVDITYISLAKNGEILSDVVIDDQKSNTTLLHFKIKEMVGLNNLALKNLNAVAVVNGPGSYTGLRVGLATAKGICYALNIPLITISTLEAMAKFVIESTDKSNYLYCPMIDARRMEVFTAIYDQNMTIVKSPQTLILDPNSFANEIKNHKIYFFGNGSSKWEKILESENADFYNIKYYNKIINKISHKMYEAKSFSDLHLVEPFYIKEFYTT